MTLFILFKLILIQNKREGYRSYHLQNLSELTPTRYKGLLRATGILPAQDIDRDTKTARHVLGSQTVYTRPLTAGKRLRTLWSPSSHAACSLTHSRDARKTLHVRYREI